MFGIGNIISSAMNFMQSNQNPLNSATGTFTGGALSPGLNQLGDNFLNGYINYYYSNKLAEKQNERQIEFWNMQNAYNHPSAQMARYDEAGLNPNLIYSQNNTAGSVGTAAVGSFNMPNNQVKTHQFDALQALTTRYAIENMSEQNKNLQAQNSLIESQRNVAEVQAQKQFLENAYFISHGQWPAQESGFVRGTKSLVNYIPELYFRLVDTLDDVLSKDTFRPRGDLGGR